MWGNLHVQFLVIISCFTFSTTPWLRLQQKTTWVNINFERRDLNSPQKSHPPPMILEKFAFSFAFNIRKRNVVDFSFISLTQNLGCVFKLLLPGTVSFSTSYQRWIIRQWLLISAPCFCLVPSLIFSTTK